jgi:1,2-dihydroxy-3-keto-5-methylthiopentene dioxygenase
MAEMIFERRPATRDLGEIQGVLAALGIELALWPPSLKARDLLDKPSLTPEEAELLLGMHDMYFEKLKREAGYQARDLIALHPDLPGLGDLLAKFDRCHTHDDDEVRYIVEGSGIFGFCLGTGEQVKLRVEAGEFINVPKGTEHWFVLDERRRIKAIRYFTSREGWVPRYTGTATRL